MASLLSTSRTPLITLPTDLSSAQRVMLTLVVLAAHLGVAVLVWRSAPAVQAVAEPPPIEVALLSTEAMAPPTPVSTLPVPPKPVPPTPVPAPTPAPVLAAARSPQSAERVAPPPVPVPPPAVPAAPVTPPSPTPVAAPAAPNAAPGPVTAAPTSDTGRTPMQPKVLPSSAVRYLVEPVLAYPRASRELGETGVVRLKVLVDEQGHPREIVVARSSGYPRLDQQAVQAMKYARFQPHIEEGAARMVWVLAPLTFNLEE